MRTIFLAAVAACAVAAVGCGGPGREQPAFGDLVPVSGVVTRANKPVSGGVLRFVPDPEKDNFLISSEVGQDGKYSLSTVRLTDSKGERKPGLAPGKYRVVYTPPLGNQAAGGETDPVELAAPITVAKAENDLKIELSGKKK